MARLSHHLGKGRLIEWTAQPLKPLSQILPLLFIMILFDFASPKITALIVSNTIHGTFSMVDFVLVPLKLY